MAGCVEALGQLDRIAARLGHQEQAVLLAAVDDPAVRTAVIFVDGDGVPVFGLNRLVVGFVLSVGSRQAGAEFAGLAGFPIDGSQAAGCIVGGQPAGWPARYADLVAVDFSLRIRRVGLPGAAVAPGAGVQIEAERLYLQAA